MAEQQEIQPRQVAYKVKIGDLLRGEYVEQEGWQPNYVKINEKHVSRINIIASVIDVAIGSSLSTITIDDGSGAIQVRAFNEDSIKLNMINIGDVVIIIGRPRKYGNQFFISHEIVKKLDPLWTKVRRKELGNFPDISSVELNIINSNETRSIPKNHFINENIHEKKKKILDLVRNMDEGNGAGVDELILNSGLSKEEAENILEDLIKNGEIYENLAGKVKLI